MATSTDTNAPVATAIAPKQYYPEVKPPVFDDAALLAVATFMGNLKFFHDFLQFKGMSPDAIIKYICHVCLVYPTAHRWGQVTTFTGTWADFAAKFTAKWVSPIEKERAGHKMMYQVWQNSLLIRPYTTAFYEAVQCCDLVGFAYTPDVLLSAFMRGLNKGYSELLARSGLDVRTIEQCEDYLARAEVRGAITSSNGSQPHNNKNPGRQHNNSNNNRNANNNNNMNGGAGSSSGNNANNNGSSNSSSGAGRNSSGGAAGGGGRGNGNWRRDDKVDAGQKSKDNK
jgi:uncharacterized membrane protein YgcG